MMTGSCFSALDQDEWILKLHEFIRSIDKNAQKVVGICFGHQVISNALGGIVEKNLKGWEVGKTTLDIKGDFFKSKIKSVVFYF
jgi:GMP synthase (glutamine-hydrolysing)